MINIEEKAKFSSIHRYFIIITQQCLYLGMCRDHRNQRIKHVNRIFDWGSTCDNCVHNRSARQWEFVPRVNMSTVVPYTLLSPSRPQTVDSQLDPVTAMARLVANKLAVFGLDE